MNTSIQTEHFTGPLFALLEETFDTHHGIYLDGGTSLLQTLAEISAEQASIPVGGKCASLAAQVEHVTFYLELLERIILTSESPSVDWGEIWRTVEKVTPAEWEAQQDRLKQAYLRILTLFKENPDWNEAAIGGALALVVHTAYHLGEIRQTLCTLR